MARINDTTTFPITPAEPDDRVIGTDISNTTNNAGGETVQFTKASLNFVKAFAVFDGTDADPITPDAALNVSSITKNGAGDYTIAFTTALTDANFATMVSIGFGGLPSSTQNDVAHFVENVSSSAVRVRTIRHSSDVGEDPTLVSVTVVR